MTSIFKNTTINANGYLQLPAGDFGQRPVVKTVIDTYTSAGQTFVWTAPNDVSAIEVLVVGGGGGGGNAQSNSGTPGGGGGGGGVIYDKNYPVTPGETYSIFVGQGGAAGAINLDGDNGQSSYFGTQGTAIVDDDFSTGTDGWTATSATIDGGPSASNTLKITPNAGVNGGAYKKITTIPGDYYKIEVTISNDSSGFGRILAGYGNIDHGSPAKNAYGYATALGNGTHELVFQAEQDETFINFEVGGGNQQVTNFDTVKVYRLNNALYALGGGGGGGATAIFNVGRTGGSGGGSCGTGNGGPALATQGNPGAAGRVRAGGGGGAGQPGDGGYNGVTGAGGNGLQVDISGTPSFYGGGGGAGGSLSGFSYPGTGGKGGGGGGGNSGDSNGAVSGSATSGGGGGGSAARGGSTSPAGSGGSGVIIIKYSYWDRGLTGDELVTNGTFDTDLTGWSNDSPMLASVSNGKALLDRNSGSSQGQLYQTITTEVGTIYEASVEVSAFSHGVQIYVDQNSVSPFAVNALGTHYYRFVASSTSTRIDVSAVQSVNATATIDNVSVKKVDSLNAVGLLRYNNDVGDLELFEDSNNKWVTPTIGKNFSGHNYFKQSQEFTSVWGTLTLTPVDNKHKAPDGTITAGVLTRTSTASAQLIQQAFSYTNLRTLSIYAKSILGGSLVLNNGPYVVHFNLETGTSTVLSNFNGLGKTKKMEYVGEGWWRCSISGYGNGSAQQQIQPWTPSMGTDWNNRYDAGDDSIGIAIWGAQVEDGPIATPYTFTGAGRATEAPVEGNGYRVHTYTDTAEPAFFTPAYSGEVEVFVVGGGGAGGSDLGAGGGGGGVVHLTNYKVQAGRSYEIVVGSGGVSAGTGQGQSTSTVQNGSPSQFGNVIAYGGGGGSCEISNSQGFSGGSGGGEGARGSRGQGIQGQGHRGGASEGSGGAHGGGGGGGAGTAGQLGRLSVYGGDGGNGVLCPIDGFYYAGGGGGCGYASGSVGGRGGAGGGGGGSAETGRIGGRGGRNPGSVGNSTTLGGIGGAAGANTGSGGGGGGEGGGGGAGADGIVMIRYKV